VGSYLRLTPALRDVLGCFLDTEGEVWGLQLASRTGRPTGTVYPILERLEREGFVRSRWENENARSGPRRRLYSLQESGREWAAARICLMPSTEDRSGP
jgi:PadR family transcriptional regulator, regulatory protein PadR